MFSMNAMLLEVSFFKKPSALLLTPHPQHCFSPPSREPSVLPHNFSMNAMLLEVSFFKNPQHCYSHLTLSTASLLHRKNLLCCLHQLLLLLHLLRRLLLLVQEALHLLLLPHGQEAAFFVNLFLFDAAAPVARIQKQMQEPLVTVLQSLWRTVTLKP